MGKLYVKRNSEAKQYECHGCRRFGDGDYLMKAGFVMGIGPGKVGYPGYAWLDGYENVKRINIAVSRIHTMDGKTIEIPEEEWLVAFIDLEQVMRHREWQTVKADQYIRTLCPV